MQTISVFSAFTGPFLWRFFGNLLLVNVLFQAVAVLSYIIRSLSPPESFQALGWTICQWWEGYEWIAKLFLGKRWTFGHPAFLEQEDPISRLVFGNADWRKVCRLGWPKYRRRNIRETSMMRKNYCKRTFQPLLYLSCICFDRRCRLCKKSGASLPYCGYHSDRSPPEQNNEPVVG